MSVAMSIAAFIATYKAEPIAASIATTSDVVVKKCLAI